MSNNSCRTKPKVPEFVYFVRQRGVRGPVKIGVSKDPVARCAQMQLCCPVDLEVAAFLSGTPSTERQFHAMLVEDYIRGEWFRPSEAVEQVIAQVVAGTFDAARLPKKTVALYLVDRQRALAVAA